MSSELEVFLMAMVPLGELRLAIPLGLEVYRLPWWQVYLIATLGNVFLALFLLLFLQKISKILEKEFQFLEKFFWWWMDRVQKRVNPYIIRYGFWGLLIFVAIPLPLTGAWTASAAAFLFRIPLRIAFTSICFGVFIAGAIVTMLSLSGVSFVRQILNFWL